MHAIKKLVDIINQNPDLPVFPAVSNSFIDWFDDHPFVDSTVGKITNVQIGEYCTYVVDDEVHFAMDYDKEWLEYEYPELTFNWQKAIFVAVDYNDELFNKK